MTLAKGTGGGGCVRIQNWGAVRALSVPYKYFDVAGNKDFDLNLGNCYSQYLLDYNIVVSILSRVAPKLPCPILDIVE